MLMIPDLVDNPLVQIDNATMITYYNLIFQGMAMDQCADDDYRRYSLYTYRRSLKLVEHWKTEPGQVMDCFAGFFMTWLAINFLDTNLAWSFLRRATIVGEKLGFFQVDAKGTDHSQESVNVVNDKRLAFWRLLQTDCLFRQHYGKPPLIQKGTWSVEFPDFNVVSMGEGPRHQIIFIIAMRLNFITIKFFEFLDSEGSKSPEALDNMIDSLAEEIETITREWNIVCITCLMTLDLTISYQCVRNIYSRARPRSQTNGSMQMLYSEVKRQ